MNCHSSFIDIVHTTLYNEGTYDKGGMQACRLVFSDFLRYGVRIT